MFLGEYQYLIDEKGRVALPSKFRKEFRGKIYLTRGLDNCLFLFPEKEWQALVEKLTSLPLSQANSRAFVRLMLAGASQVKIDKQGRINIPDYLRRYSFLKKEVVICGLYKRVEIWDKNQWQKYKRKTEKEAIDIAQELEGVI